MADDKYGRIFTQDDARSLVEACLNTGKSYDELIQSGEFTFPADEPLFVLRGQDETALETIEEYKFLNRTNPNDQLLEAVAASLREFRKFKDENPGRMKTAD